MKLPRVFEVFKTHHYHAHVVLYDVYVRCFAIKTSALMHVIESLMAVLDFVILFASSSLFAVSVTRVIETIPSSAGCNIMSSLSL